MCNCTVPLIRLSALWFLLASRFVVHGLEIRDPQVTEQDWFVFSFSSRSNAYYRVFFSTNVSTVTQPGGQISVLPLGAAERTVSLGAATLSAGFIQVQEVPLETPFDTDGDGIDDVWELQRAAVLNPLNPADAATDPDGDGRTLLQEYQQIRYDHAAPEILAANPGGGRVIAGGQGTNVVVAFDEPLEVSSLVPATFRLFSAGADQIINTPDDVRVPDAGASYQATLRTWSLGFDQPLPDGTYRAEIAGQIRDQVGNTRAGTTAWRFRVVDQDLTQGAALFGEGALLGGAKDQYRFTASPGQVVLLARDRNWSGDVHWQLRDEAGESVFESTGMASFRGPDRVVLNRGGRYTLEVGLEQGFTGYRFRLYSVPAPQEFPLVVGASVTNGVPATGAGLIETVGAQDIYTFEAASGQVVYLQVTHTTDTAESLIWELRDEAGEQLFQGNLGQIGSWRVVLARGGRYRLTVNPNLSSAVGGYAFSLLPAPPVQEFSLSLGDSVTNGVPGLGAGVIETPGSQDRYTFEAPPGQWVYFQLDQLGDTAALLSWRLQDADGTELVQSQLRAGRPGHFLLERGGRYTLTVNSEARTAVAGTYAFSLLPEAQPPVYHLALGEVVKPGVPAAGAGVIETPGSRDVYTFEAAPGQEVHFDIHQSELVGKARWLIQDEDGATVFNEIYQANYPGRLVLQRGGRYTLTVNYSGSSTVGAYGFSIQPRLRREFPLAIGAFVTNGIPAAGAGVLQVPWEQDVYTFEASPGQEVFFRFHGSGFVPFYSETWWELQDAEGTSVFSRGFNGGSPGRVRLERGGRYTLTVQTLYSSLPQPSNYSFSLLPAPPSQEFAVALGSTVTPGVPGPGAGALEQPGAQDIYTFEAAPGQVAYFQFHDPGNPGFFSWKLQNAGGVELFNGPAGAGNSHRVVLGQGGRYALIVYSSASFTVERAYSLELVSVAPPQEFALKLGDSVTNGVPAAGAGLIEAPGAQDSYTFEAAAGQAVDVRIRGFAETLKSASWRLQEQDGTWAIKQSISVAPTQVVLPRAGRYRLTINTDERSEAVGAYGFSLLPLPQPYWVLVGAAITNGVPGPGAGVLELPGASDRYTFDAAPDQVVFLRFDAHDGVLDRLGWQLRDEGGTGISGALLPGTPARASLHHGGRHTLTISNEWLTTGSYAFSILPTPPPQMFLLSLGASVASGVPGPGAGTLEALGAQDIYAFDAEPGQAVWLQVGSSSAALADVRWEVRDDRSIRLSQGTLGQGSSGRIDLPRGGRHTLTVNPTSLSGGTGTYALSLLPAPVPQSFSLQLGDSVTNGVPAAGAGVVQAPAEQDLYTFDAAPGQTVFVRMDGFTGTAGLATWQLRDAAGVQVFGKQFSSGNPGRMVLSRGGRYTLTFNTNPDQPGMGTYAFSVLPVVSQQFAVSLDLMVTNQVPLPGAGNIETPGSQDIYTFDAAPGQEVFIERMGTSSPLSLGQLQDETGVIVYPTVTYSPFEASRVTLVRGGRYTFTVNPNPASSVTGPYGLRIRIVPPPQRFTLAVGDTVTNGVPGPGAGAIEVPMAQDIYTFEATPGQFVGFKATSVSTNLFSAKWRLQDEDGNVVFESYLGFTTGWKDLARGGRYTLTVNSDPQYRNTGTYAFRLVKSPPPQSFQLTLGEPVSEGVPGPGAGELEAEGARDIYTFEAAPGQVVLFIADYERSVRYAWCVLRDAVGTVVFQTQLSFGTSRIALERGGPYTLTVSDGVSFFSSAPAVGTYSLKVQPIAPAQEFSLPLGSFVTNGVPAAGAGEIESVGARDIYTFDAEPMQVVGLWLDRVDESLLYASWQLRDETGANVYQARFNAGHPGRLVLEQGGRYTLTVNSDPLSKDVGTYAFHLVRIGPVPVYTLKLGDTVTNGVPAPGAGYVELMGPPDYYTFDAARGQVVFFQLNSMDDTAYAVQWQLWDESTKLFEHSLSWGHPGEVTLQRGGRYTVIVNSFPASTAYGAYSFSILPLP